MGPHRLTWPPRHAHSYCCCSNAAGGTLLLRTLQVLFGVAPTVSAEALPDGKATGVVVPSEQLQLAMALQLQDRFGALLVDLRGTAACLIFAGVRPWLVSLRGLLLGAFLGG